MYRDPCSRCAELERQLATVKARPRPRRLSLRGRQFVWIGTPTVVSFLVTLVTTGLVSGDPRGWGAGAGFGIIAAMIVGALAALLGSWLSWRASSLWEVDKSA